MTTEASAGELVAGRSYAWLRWFGAFVGTVLAAAVLVGAFLFGLAQINEGRALPGVTAAGISVGGLDRAGVEARLRARLPALTSGQIVLTHGSAQAVVSYADLGRSYDYAAMADQAVGFGRSGSIAERALDEVRGLARGFAIAPLVQYDRSAVERAVDRAATKFDVYGSDASVTGAANGSFTVVPGAAGAQVDQAALSSAIVQAIATTKPGDTSIEVPIVGTPPVITVPQAQAAVQQATAMTSSGLTLTVSSDKTLTFKFSAATLRRWIAFEATPNGGLQPTVATAMARAAIAKLAPKVAKPARDATFVLSNGKAVGAVPGANGQALDVAATLTAIDAALQNLGTGSPPPSVALAVMPIIPKLSTEDAARIAPLMQPLDPKGPDGKPGWTTWYEVSERNFWSKNITTPALKLNNYVVEPGAIFSFWGAIGDPRGQPGYGPGGAIIGGHSKPTGAWAGGICSTSTTLFNAAVRAGLTILERYNHYYYITRYPVGLDATVSLSDGGGGQDMVFRNDTAYPIVIRSSASPGIVHFEIWGVPDGRTTTFSTGPKTNYTRAGDSVQYTTALAPGVRQRIEFVTDGFNITVTRIVKDKNGKIIHRDSFYSHYATVTGILLIGKAADQPPADTGAGATPAPTPPPGG